MDSSTQLPEEVQALLRERIGAVEELEALLLLHGQPARFWSEAQIAAELRANQQLVGSAVSSLLRHSLVRRTDKGLLIYGSGDGEVDRVVGDLARCYEQQRVEILVFISRLAITRVREGALRTFAESFHILGRKKDG